MTETTTDQKSNEATDMFKSSLTTLQTRIDALEAEARGQLRRALGASNDALKELDGALARVSRDGIAGVGVRRRLDELKARAESFRASALKRVAEMPSTAVTAIATTSRVPVQNLAKGIERIAKRLEVTEPPKA
jgi:hypothetical protein